MSNSMPPGVSMRASTLNMSTMAAVKPRGSGQLWVLLHFKMCPAARFPSPVRAEIL